MNLEAHLLERGLKPTAMRLVVMQALIEARRPLSLRDMEDRLPTAERTTLYRALVLLADHHLAHIVDDGSGAAKYEACRGEHECTLADQHPHFYCVRCHRTYCLTREPLPDISLGGGFEVQSVALSLKGLCPNCSK